MTITKERALELLISRRDGFIEQTRLISHVVEKTAIDEVIEAYDLAISAVREALGQAPVKSRD